MAHGPKPTVRYWKGRKAYACWIGQDRHFLARGPDDAPNGPTYLAALDRFRKLVAQDAGKGTDDYLVSALLNQYRAHLKTTRKSGAPGVFEVMARRFAKEFGGKRVCDLKPYDFDRWLNGQETWNSTTRAHAVALILGALSWAQKKGFIATDPLAGRIERPQPTLRGREARMPEGLMDLLIGECFEKATRAFADASLAKLATPQTVADAARWFRLAYRVAGYRSPSVEQYSHDRDGAEGLPGTPPVAAPRPSTERPDDPFGPQVVAEA